MSFKHTEADTTIFGIYATLKDIYDDPIIIEPCTGETYEKVELGQKVRSEGQQGYRQGN